MPKNFFICVFFLIFLTLFFNEITCRKVASQSSAAKPAAKPIAKPASPPKKADKSWARSMIDSAKQKYHSTKEKAKEKYQSVKLNVKEKLKSDRNRPRNENVLPKPTKKSLFERVKEKAEKGQYVQKAMRFVKKDLGIGEQGPKQPSKILKFGKKAAQWMLKKKTPKITENHPAPPIHSVIAANLHENVETTNVEIEEELEILENSVQDSWNTSEAGTKYKLFDEAKSWNDAQLHCEEFGSHLAFLDSESKNQYAKELLHDYGIRHVWFGLRTDVEDVPGQAQDFSNFEGLNGCGVVDQNGVWSISACTMLLPYLCQAMRFDVFVEIA